MAPDEFALWLMGVLVFALMSSIFVSAQSSNPSKVFVICLAIDCIVVIAIAMIGVACYAIAWGWRNPVISGILAVLGIFAYLKYRSDNMLPQEKKS